MIIILLQGLLTHIPAQSLQFQGQISSWLTFRPDPDTEGQIGMRYLPALTLGKYLSGNYQLDTEISLNTFYTAAFDEYSDPDTEGEIKPYRIWVRLTTNQFEIRAGLQKINFGSASLLRSLMWFDRIDPRDPLKLTDGVYGLLGRYYFLNNTNIWGWVLYGNEDTKGWEIFPTEERTAEYGGRLQLPLLTGEIALSVHHRQADLPDEFNHNSDHSKPENRFALDGKWDAGIGVWFEGVVIDNNLDQSAGFPRYRRMVTLGTDYTFDWGNGLHILAEYLRADASGEFYDFSRPSSISAFATDYPLGLLDNLNIIFYYDWANDDVYRFVNWQRTYDKWSFYLIGFWNPSQFQVYRNQQDNNLFSGKGIQIMAVYNH